MGDSIRSARTMVESGDVAEGVRLWREAIGRMKTDAVRQRHYLQMVVALQKRGQIYQAAEAMADVLRIQPDYEDTYGYTVADTMGLFCDQLDRPGDAVALFEELLGDSEPGRGNGLLWFNLAWIRHNMGELERADGIYGALSRTLTDADPLQNLLRRSREYRMDDSPATPSFKKNLDAANLIPPLQARLTDRQWADAELLLTQLLRQFPDTAFDAAGVLATGCRTHVEQVVQSLPEPIRREWEAFLKSDLDRLIASGNADALGAFAATHPGLEFGGRLDAALADALAHEGRYAQAAARYRRAARFAPGEAERDLRLFKFARARLLAGEPLPADLPLDAALTVAGRETTFRAALEEWTAAQVPAPDTTASEPVPVTEMRPLHLPLWQAPLPYRKWQAGTDAAVGDRHTVNESFIPYTLAGDRQQVFLNNSEMVYAIDPVRNEILWTRGPSELFVSEVLPPVLKNVRLINASKMFRVAVCPRRVYYCLNWGERTSESKRSAVFAADRQTGELIWSSQHHPELANLVMVSDPAYHDGVVIAAAWELLEIPSFHLLGFDAVTGDLMWKTQLYSGTMFPALRGRTFLDTPLASPAPAVADGNAWFYSDTGVAVCVDVLTGQMRWAKEYPRFKLYGPEGWAGSFVFNRPVSAPRVSGGKVLAAPRDYRGVIFMDAASGTVLHRYETIDFRSFFGMDDAFAYIQEGNAIAAIRLENAQRAWRVPLPVSRILGLPSLSPRGILCSTSDGLYRIALDGSSAERVQPPVAEQAGSPLDLGDRILLAAPSSLTLLAADPGDSTRWLLPHSPATVGAKGAVPSSDSPMRWALPAPDRADFYLSRYASDLMITRGWESYQMIRIGDFPTTLWEYHGRGWPNTIQFDRNSLVLEYDNGQIDVVDGATGQSRWTRSIPSMTHDRGVGGATPFGDTIVWFSTVQAAVLDTRTGATLWEHRFSDALIRGVCLLPEGVGLILRGLNAPTRAALFDTRSGHLIREILLSAESADVQGVSDGMANAIDSLPAAWLDYKTLAQIDFERGQATFTELPNLASAPRVRVENDVIYGVGDGGFLAACSWPGLEPLKSRRVPAFDIEDSVQYYGYGARVIALDMRTDTPLWQSAAFEWPIRHVHVSGDTVLAVEYTEQGNRRRTRVSLLDRKTGEILGGLPTLAYQLNKTEGQGPRLIANDDGYVYCFDASAPRGATLAFHQERADPTALSAVKIARDSVGEPVVPPRPGNHPALADGRLGEWSKADWRALDAHADWHPDPVFLAPLSRTRLPADAADCSARMAWTRDGDWTTLAVEVRDDIHNTRPGRPLDRGDSITLRWQPRSGQAGFTLTLALIDGVSVAEYGPGYQATRVLPSPQGWNPATREQFAAETLPWLRRWGGGPPENLLRAGIVRDERAGTTVYEIALHRDFYPALADPAQDTSWDLAVNDADGDGLEGALSLGSGMQQMVWPMGYAPWAPETQ